jgi:hypothetical protein
MAAGPMSTGAAAAAPPEKPLCTATMRVPPVAAMADTRPRNASPVASVNDQPGPGACVYTFHAAIG